MRRSGRICKSSAKLWRPENFCECLKAFANVWDRLRMFESVCEFLRRFAKLRRSKNICVGLWNWEVKKLYETLRSCETLWNFVKFQRSVKINGTGMKIWKHEGVFLHISRLTYMYSCMLTSWHWGFDMLHCFDQHVHLWTESVLFRACNVYSHLWSLWYEVMKVYRCTDLMMPCLYGGSEFWRFWGMEVQSFGGL